MTIGIISAVPGERGSLVDELSSVVSEKRGGRTYYKGQCRGADVVVVAARIGKVAAAEATTHLLVEYGVDLVIFVGVAGALDASLNVGDVVVAESLMQHDVDCRPCGALYELPLLHITRLESDPLLCRLAEGAVQQFMTHHLHKKMDASVLQTFKITAPKVVQGLVLTGDQVISQDEQKQRLKESLPEALCVEMEGASVAQVCYEYGVPFVVIRTISDYANHADASFTIKHFVDAVGGVYGQLIVGEFCDCILTEAAAR